MEIKEYEDKIKEFEKDPSSLICFYVPQNPSIDFLNFLLNISEDLEFSINDRCYIKTLKLSKYKETIENFPFKLKIQYPENDVTFSVGSKEWEDTFYYILKFRQGTRFFFKQGHCYCKREARNNITIESIKSLTPDFLGSIDIDDFRNLIRFGFLEELLNEKETRDIVISSFRDSDKLPF